MFDNLNLTKIFGRKRGNCGQVRYLFQDPKGQSSTLFWFVVEVYYDSKAGVIWRLLKKASPVVRIL